MYLQSRNIDIGQEPQHRFPTMGVGPHGEILLISVLHLERSRRELCIVIVPVVKFQRTIIIAGKIGPRGLLLQYLNPTIEESKQEPFTDIETEPVYQHIISRAGKNGRHGRNLL